MNVRELGSIELEKLQFEVTVEQAKRRAAREVESDSPSGSANLGKAVDPRYDRQANMTSPVSERLNLGNIEDAMRYQPWTLDQQEAGEQIREVLTQAAKTILRTVPDGAFRSVALRNIIDARMNANAGISFRGRF